MYGIKETKVILLPLLEKRLKGNFSAKEYILSGAPNIFSRPREIYDDKFFDDFTIPSNTWYMYDNKPLRESIKRNVHFPIATSYYDDKKQPIKQPRLLTVSV